MLKLKCGTYDKVPVLYCPYRSIMTREQNLTYKISLQRQHNWYALFPWYGPFHKWTWYELCQNFGKENIELDEKALKYFAHYEDLAGKIKNHTLSEGFEFYTEPYPFQLEDFFRLTYWDRIPLFIECGLGKSKIVLDSIRHNRSCALYICPSPLIGNMINEVEKHANNEIQVVPINVDWFRKFSKHMGFTSKDYKGTKQDPVPNWKRHTESIKDYFTEQLKWLDRDKPILLLSTYSMLSTYPEILFKFLKYDMFVADESHKIKTSKSQRTKSALLLASKAKKRVLMSGTASLGTPIDLYPQYKLLDEAILGRDYKKFFDKYCKPDSNFKWKPVAFKRLDVLNTLIQPITIIQSKEECLPDLPERTQSIYTCALSTKEEIVAYTSMSKIDWWKDDGDTFNFRGKSLWIKHGAVKMLKMKQLASGFINMAQPNYELCNSCRHVRECSRDEISPNTSKCKVDPTPVPPEIEYMNSPSKIRLLKELLDNILVGTNEKIIINAHFTAELDLIEEAVRELCIPTYRIDGNTSDTGKVTVDASCEKGPAVLIAQIACGIGWNFIIANKVIYYSLDLQYESFAQSRDRVRRIGQKFNITEYHLHSLDTLDAKVKFLIDDKGHIVDTLLSKTCGDCKHRSFDCIGNIKWSEDCFYSKEYVKPTLDLRIHEVEIHKLAMKMV